MTVVKSKEIVSMYQYFFFEKKKHKKNKQKKNNRTFFQIHEYQDWNESVQWQDSQTER